VVHSTAYFSTTVLPVTPSPSQSNSVMSMLLGLFLTADNFATVNERKASDMLKVSKFCLEKEKKLACQCISVFFA